MAGLYIHIPFCHSKCAYCDFYSIPSKSNDTETRFAQAIRKEFEMRHGNMPFETIYIGGGTPSALAENTIRNIGSWLPNKPTEFTIEINPEDASTDKLNSLRSIGANRISMGVQSLVDNELLVIGRRHNSDQAIKAVQNIKDSGFDNFSLDLIFGLPGQTVDSWKYSLRRMLDMRPTHFSAYMLSYEPKTKLTAMLKTGKIKETPEDALIEMYNILVECAREFGYEHYEISNFALEHHSSSFRALHNSNYWKGLPYLGLGPAAHSFDGNSRSYNPSSLKIYLESIENGNIATVTDYEDENNVFNDSIMTALRTSEGLNISKIEPQRRKQLLADAEAYIASGHLVLNGSFLSIPELSWMISDSIISDLFQV